MARMYRQPSEETKQRISQALKNRPKSISTRSKIADGMKRYWETIPSKDEADDGDNGAGWDDVM